MSSFCLFFATVFFPMQLFGCQDIVCMIQSVQVPRLSTHKSIDATSNSGSPTASCVLRVIEEALPGRRPYRMTQFVGLALTPYGGAGSYHVKTSRLPWGPVVKSPRSCCRLQSSIPGWGTKILHVAKFFFLNKDKGISIARWALSHPIHTEPRILPYYR